MAIGSGYFEPLTRGRIYITSCSSTTPGGDAIFANTSASRYLFLTGATRREVGFSERIALFFGSLDELWPTLATHRKAAT
jgi:hypothetical protein